MTQDPFTPDVVAAIARHMNDDHPADSLLIVRLLGGVPDATSTKMTGVNADRATFTAEVKSGTVQVHLPWSHRLTERTQVRAEVVRMHTEATRLRDLPPEERFSARLRAATRPEHGDTEQSTYMTALLNGDLPRDEYATLLGQLHIVYTALEDAADRLRDDPTVARFDLPGLRRRTALEADLEFYWGPDWPSHIQPTDATRRHRERLDEVCATWPAGYIAHHYTHYLGDLSGGQVIGRRLAQTYNLDNTEGVRFYHFNEPPKRLKDRYRTLLDTAPWDEQEQDRVITEVRTAYHLNAALTKALTP
ncbi:hypothetical protein GCM10022254_34720 [Actinomadura meridiana]|uniref:DUF2470 domain-containing protein n=1 Tax=Actinomadura meridiana TaxID=559626 RepID=A0ABP8C4M7_9ACTN